MDETTTSPAPSPAPASEPSHPRWYKTWYKNRTVITTAIIVAVVLILGGLGYYYKSLLIAATVDGHIIGRLTVIKDLENANGKDALDRLVNNQLINDAAQKQNITVSTDEVNQEIDRYKTSIEAQGATLDAALAQQGLTMDEFKSEVVIELKLEKLLGDQIKVTDDEINQYITDNKVTIPAGQEATTKAQISEELKQEKLSNTANQYLSDLASKAKIKTYVSY